MAKTVSLLFWYIMGLTIILCAPAQSQECRLLYTCSECLLKNSSCGWCNDESVFMKYANNVNLQLLPAALCGTIDELKEKACPEKNIINPQGSVKKSNDTVDIVGSAINEISVSPQSAAVTIRPGISQTFSIKVQPPTFISVDMYILMDLSFTMKDDLSSLIDLTDDIVEQMRDLTDEFRIGFGSFIDKPVSPFADKLNIDFPCVADSASITPAQCERTYAFKHRLSLTDNVTLVKEQLRNAKLSGSVDNPEGMLDGLLQVALCENEIGWREQGEARRLVLALSDGDYHIALDGKLAGIRHQPDRQCRLNTSTGDYDYGAQVDYPSSTFLADVLNEGRIIPIFGVAPSYISVYNQLSNIIRSAFVGELASDGDNILNLISTQYRRLSTTIVPVVKGIEEISELSITPIPVDNCVLEVNSTDICVNVTHLDTVTYNVTISAHPDICNRDDIKSTILSQILFIGFGAVQLNLSVLCSCPCEASKVKMSSRCNNVGTYECSTCLCPQNYNGPQCGCSGTAGITRGLGCRPSGSEGNATVCSGRGDCICDQCYCYNVSNILQYTYQGQYCECDPSACPSGVHETSGQILPCTGHGICGCNSQCMCDPGYSGLNCECSNRTSTCVAPGINNRELCSNAGQCTCGTCVCNDYSQRYGRYCEECGVCTRSCSLLAQCVKCYIEGSCGSSCNHINITSRIEDVPNYNVSNFSFRNCSVNRDSCEVTYRVDKYILGTEDHIVVLLDNTQQDYVTWRNNPNDCSSQLVIWPIPVAIVLCILFIAILVLALWKGISYLIEYLEYKAWKDSQDREQWNASNDNPLFVDPTTTHTNPKYRRPVNVQRD